MKIFKLCYDYAEDPNIKNLPIKVVIDESSLGFDRYDADRGKVFTEWNDKIVATYEYEEGRPITDYVSNVLGWFMVTERFKDLLIDLNIEGLQFHPITLKCSNMDREDIVVYLANILTLVDEAAIDLERSKYSIWELEEYGIRMLSVKRYCLKSSFIQGHDIFRPSHSVSAIFSSERLKKAVEENGITGCNFREIEVV